MIHPEVTILYKYKKLYKTSNENIIIDEKLIDSISKNEFWYAKPNMNNFNDPFDCNIQMEPSIESEELKKILESKGGKHSFIKNLTIEKANKIMKEYSDSIKENFKNKGVFCLTESNDNLLMWSHYGDRHRGICIGFKREGTILSGNDQTKPVRYAHKYQKLKLSEYAALANNQRTEFNQTLLWTKSIDWAYEREWRSVQSTGDRLVAIDAPIETITFGSLVPHSVIEEFLKKIEHKTNKIRFYTTQMSFFDYSIILKELNL